MKINKQSTFIFPLVAALFLASCKKEEEKPIEVPQEIYPKITINDPMQTHYDVSDTAFVRVVVQDAVEMHEAECWFIAQPQNDTLWYLRRHNHSAVFNINSHYIVEELPDEQQVEFIVRAENAAGDVTTAKHVFEVHDH